MIRVQRSSTWWDIAYARVILSHVIENAQPLPWEAPATIVDTILAFAKKRKRKKSWLGWTQDIPIFLSKSCGDSHAFDADQLESLWLLPPVKHCVWASQHAHRSVMWQRLIILVTVRGTCVCKVDTCASRLRRTAQVERKLPTLKRSRRWLMTIKTEVTRPKSFRTRNKGNNYNTSFFFLFFFLKYMYYFPHSANLTLCKCDLLISGPRLLIIHVIVTGRLSFSS